MSPLLAATLIANVLWTVALVTFVAKMLLRADGWPIGVRRACDIMIAAQCFAALEAVLEQDWIGLGFAGVMAGAYAWLRERLPDDDDDIDRWRKSAREKGKALLRTFAPSPIPAPVAKRSC